MNVCGSAYENGYMVDGMCATAGSNISYKVYYTSQALILYELIVRVTLTMYIPLP